MLGSQNHVFHAGLFRRFCPFPRLEINGVELLEIFHVIFFWNLLGTPHPFSARRDGIKSPVDKHAETGVAVPLHPPVIGFSVKFVHRFASSCFSFILVMIRLNLDFHPFSLFESDRRKDKP